MAEESRGPFREKSLERLSSPERLDQLLRVVDRKSWVPLVALAGLVSFVVAWSVIGRVPVNVEGKGILGSPRKIVECEAPADGHLAELLVRVGDVAEAGQVLARLRRTDLEKELALEREKKEDLAARIRAVRLPVLESLGSAGALAAPDPQDDVGNYIRTFRALAEALREKELEDLAQEERRLEEQWTLARDLAKSRKERLEAQKKLVAEGIVASETLVGIEALLVDGLSKMSDVESKRRDMRMHQLESEERYLDRIARISDREQHYADVNRRISLLEIALEEGSTIRAERAGRVVEISASVGEYLEAGDRVGSMAIGDEGRPGESLAYFRVKDGKRLLPGMPIQVTPDTVERERYGAIVGTVTSISPFPVTLAEAEKVVGSREMAEALVSGGYRIQVIAELESDPATFSAYRWTSSRGPDFTITAGTTTTARVAVEERAPITFVIPILKTAAGID